MGIRVPVAALAAAWWMAVLPAVAQGPAGTGAPPDAAAGRVLAERMCSACHVVGPAQKGPVPDAVPSFMTLARVLPEDPESAAARLLAGPHPDMPEPPLTRRQLLDVAAYILSLDRS